jgi:hypothetical protein
MHVSPRYCRCESFISLCPQDCSGRGYCLPEKYLAELAGRTYSRPWDAFKASGCICDKGARGPDCSMLVSTTSLHAVASTFVFLHAFLLMNPDLSMNKPLVHTYAHSYIMYMYMHRSVPRLRTLSLDSVASPGGTARAGEYVIITRVSNHASYVCLYACTYLNENYFSQDL